MSDVWCKTGVDDQGRHWLFYREYDTDEDEYVLHQMVELDGMKMDIALSGFPEEKYVSIFDSFDTKAAMEEGCKIISKLQLAQAHVPAK